MIAHREMECDQSMACTTFSWRTLKYFMLFRKAGGFLGPTDLVPALFSLGLSGRSIAVASKLQRVLPQKPLSRLSNTVPLLEFDAWTEGFIGQPLVKNSASICRCKEKSRTPPIRATDFMRPRARRAFRQGGYRHGRGPRDGCGHLRSRPQSGQKRASRHPTPASSRRRASSLRSWSSCCA